jgi:tyrosyl-tRNA synthetase
MLTLTATLACCAAAKTPATAAAYVTFASFGSSHMSRLRSPFLQTAVERGFVHQCTDLDGLDAATAGGPIAGYIGFDCTAPSLHAGSLVSIMLLRAFQQAGHKPIVLMGGGTTKIGDPSLRDEARKLLGEDEIAANMAGIRRVFSRYLRFGNGPSEAIMVDNADWLDGLNYIAFLRDYGRHFSVNRMLGFESVRLRLEREQALSFLEFNYMILQAYDFLELSRRHDCILQMGGSDQWGNIVNGVELARRVDGRSVFGLTTPLLTTASGAKMGKTAAGAVWLNEEMLSPYDYWQFWRNTEDADVGRFLRLFTELPLSTIEELEGRQGAAINDAKVVLANEATRLCHGEDARAQAAETARRTFVITPASGLVSVVGGLPTLEVARSELEAGIPAFEAFRRAGLAASNSEARRLVKAGGARISNATFADETRLITAADLDGDGLVKLSAGKKRHALLRVAG